MKRTFGPYLNPAGVRTQPCMPAKRTSGTTTAECGKRQNTSQTQILLSSEPTSRHSVYSPISPSILLAERPSRQFAVDASIVLIGFRGSGKSTLALMAASNLGLRLLDTDEYWESVVGKSRSDYGKIHTKTECRLREVQVLEKMLKENATGYVIACDSSCAERSVQLLFKEYAKTHPIIYVHREPEAIQEYLQSKDREQIGRLLSISKPWYLACSNFEFFNVTEPIMSEDANFGVTSKAYVPYRGTSSFSFLALKSTEQNFLRFIRGIHDTNENIICRAGIHTLAATPLESRPYTYVLTIPNTVNPDAFISDHLLRTSLDAYELKFVLKDPCPSEESGILSNSIRDSISKTFASMRRQSCVPLIFHAELDPECAPNPLYLELLHYGLRFCPDYLSVDLRCNKEVFQSIRNACGSTKILGHYMDPEPFQDSWNSKSRFAKYLAAWDMGCHMVRLVQHAISIDDNLGVQQFHRKINALSGPHPPLIAYNTGLLGRTSTILNSLLTPVVQPASYDKGIAASTMITATEAQRALYAMFILHPMLFCVIGAKVSHSLAPAMHSAACRAWGIPHEWTPKEGSSLDALDELVNSPVFGGAMISLPYKSEVLSYLHSISPAAAAIGAVNTIVPLRFELDPNIPCHLDPRFRKHQSGHIKALYGDNTDWIGFRNCICHSLSPANAIRHGTTGLVIGAGGMARAAVYAMLQVGIKNIAIYNRTLEKAEQVAEHFNNADFCRPDSAVEHTMASVLGGVREAAMGVVVLKSRSDPWPDVMRLPTVIVSTLPGYGAGRDAAPDFLLPDQWLKSSTGGAFIEFAYEPVKSPLFRQMQAKSEAGWVIVDGLDVLPEQGFAQFELFTGRIAPKRLMRMEVLRSYKQGATDDEQAYIEARLRHLQHVADWDA